MLIQCFIQRAASSASSADAASPFRLTMAGYAATAVAAGSIAWYYHLYGQDLYAMTPVEEG
jgi:ubiquinol-cytochrome c reductase cytochrome c1 subunit